MTIQAQILELIQKVQRELGIAVIIITHNLGVVARYVDRINVMYAGRIVERGTLHEVFDDPRHPYTRGLLASVPRLDKPKGHRLVPIEGMPPDLSNLPEGCAFRDRCATPSSGAPTMCRTSSLCGAGTAGTAWRAGPRTPRPLCRGAGTR